MAKFVPREKLSKKKRKALDAKNRIIWDISPVTKLKESKKNYKREKIRFECYDKSGSFLFADKS